MFQMVNSLVTADHKVVKKYLHKCRNAIQKDFDNDSLKRTRHCLKKNILIYDYNENTPFGDKGRLGTSESDSNCSC